MSNIKANAETLQCKKVYVYTKFGGSCIATDATFCKCRDYFRPDLKICPFRCFNMFKSYALFDCIGPENTITGKNV